MLPNRIEQLASLVHIYNIRVLRKTTNVSQLTIPAKYDNGKVRDIRTTGKALLQCPDMPSVLFHRIIQPVFLPPISQDLCPIFLIALAENPTAVFLYLKNNYASFGGNNQIYLRSTACGFLYTIVR